MIQERPLPLIDAEISETELTGFGAVETGSHGCLPLVAMDVRVHVSGLWSRTRIEQTFRNTIGEPIEATYIFPLPDRAAVHSCVLFVGERRLDAELKERAAARSAYDQGIASGHRTAIAEEDRSGVFSLRAGNIPPGETVKVEFEMVGPLEVDGGEATVRFPLVVAPRYVPGVLLDGVSVGRGIAPDTDQVPDASRITPPVLLPGFPNPVALSLEVEIDPAGLEPSPGAWHDRLVCSLHSAVTESGPPWSVRLQPGERLDRDFLLRFPVTGPEMSGSLQVAPATSSQSGTLAVTLTPDQVESGSALETPARDVIVLIDRSGSMGGWKMVAARRAAGRLIDSLGDDDRFGVMAFDHVTEIDTDGLQPATDRNRFRAVGWLSNLEARGGTEMDQPLAQAAGWLSRSGDRDPIIVLVTDGQVAGEDMLLRQLAEASGDRMPRVFAVGIDQAVNAGFLRRLTDLGGGVCELVESEDRLDEVMDRIARRLQPPRLTDLTIESDNLTWEPSSLVPSRLPDVFAGRPVTILARHASSQGPVRVRVRGRRPDGSNWSTELVGTSSDAVTLSSAWGRHRVRELEDRVAAGSVDDVEELQKEIVRVSLESGVLSRYTAFVVVDEAETIDSQAPPVEIIQPVEMPNALRSCSIDYCGTQFDEYELEERHLRTSGSCAVPQQYYDMADTPNRAQPLLDLSASRGIVEQFVGELLDTLEELQAMQPSDDPVRVVAKVAKPLKKLRKLARRNRHSWTAAIEELYTETSGYLKWLRRPKGQPGPFSTLGAWIERVSDVLRQLPGENGAVRDPQNMFWT